jgi:hypothetical protein
VKGLFPAHIRCLSRYYCMPWMCMYAEMMLWQALACVGWCAPAAAAGHQQLVCHLDASLAR